MNKFEFFCFLKKVLVAAKNAGWEHKPEYDRYIADEITLCFSKYENGKEVMALDIDFDLCTIDVAKSGVAKFESCCGARILKGEDIPFADVEKLFDPRCLIAYGHCEREYA